MFTLWRWSQIKIYIKCPRDIESVENNPSTVYSSELRVVVQLMSLCNPKNVIQSMLTLILIITQCYKYLLEVSEQTI